MPCKHSSDKMYDLFVENGDKFSWRVRGRRHCGVSSLHGWRCPGERTALADGSSARWVWEEWDHINPLTSKSFFFQNTLFFYIFQIQSNVWIWNLSSTMIILSALWVLMSWCFSTRTSIPTVLSVHPCTSSCLGLLFIHPSIHIHFRLRCCLCPILWGWQSLAAYHQGVLLT